MSQVSDSFSDAELTQLAADVIYDLRNSKPPIDPSFLLFKVDSDDISDVHYNAPSLYPYSTSTDTSIYTKSYPAESEYKYQISNISTDDSFYNSLPPIPSAKSYTIPTITSLQSNSQFSQSVISKPHTTSLIVIGNKKRGVKQWHKRNKNKNNEKRHNSATIYGSSSIQSIDTSSCLSFQKRKKTKTKNSQIPDFMKHTTNKVHNKKKRKHKKKKKIQRPRLQKKT
eukprot:282078_1